MKYSQWRTADILVKGIGVAVIAGAISFYDINQQKIQNELARKERRLDAAIQFGSGQKNLDVNLGMEIFDDFITHYLKSEHDDREINFRQKILMLRLMALNFQDVPINLKPLFEDLNDQLKNSNSFHTSSAIKEISHEKASELRESLIDVAKELANRQAFRLTFLGGNLEKEKEFVEGEEKNFDLIPYRLRVIDVREEEVEVVVEELIYNDSGNVIDQPGRKIGPFSLSYFDMPLVDNLKADETTRIAVNLRGIDGKKASIRIMHFINDLAADRFDLKEMSRQFVDDEQQEESKSWIEDLF